MAELHGVGERRNDWQTRLRPPVVSDAPAQHQTARVEDAPDLPVEGMCTAETPVVYQTLLRPKEDWSVPGSRIDAILAKSAQHSFEVNAGSSRPVPVPSRPSATSVPPSAQSAGTTTCSVVAAAPLRVDVPVALDGDRRMFAFYVDPTLVVERPT